MALMADAVGFEDFCFKHYIQMSFTRVQSFSAVVHTAPPRPIKITTGAVEGSQELCHYSKPPKRLQDLSFDNIITMLGQFFTVEK